MPGLKVRDLRIGGHVVPETELVFDDPNAARQLDSSVRGLLGVSALNGIDFALTPSTGRLELYANRPAGEAVPFYRVEGRIALKTRMGAETLLLTLDSGSTNVVLFHTPGAMAKTRSVPTAFATLEGARSVVPTTWTAEMTFADTLRVGVLPAAIVERRGAEIDGLLPASIFKTIYIDQAHGEAVLVRDSRSPRETK